MNDELYAEYNAAIGALMLAQKQYRDACEEQGTESWAAERAHEYLDREIEHRDRMRERYDAARHRTPGVRDGGAHLSVAHEAFERWDEDGGAQATEKSVEREPEATPSGDRGESQAASPGPKMSDDTQRAPGTTK